MSIRSNAETPGARGAGVRRPRVRRAAVRVAVALVAVAPSAVVLPGSAAAALRVTKWEAGTCTQVNCEDLGPPSRFYTQAAGHPDFGITDFRFESEKTGPGHEVPTGQVKDVRVDLPEGLAVNPQATEQCSEAQLEAFNCPAASQVGEDEATGAASVLELLHLGLTVTEHFPVYNMQRRPGQPARFGVEVNSPTLELLAGLGHDLRGHIYLEGGLSWHHEAETSESSGVPTGDYHEYFEIQNIPQQPEVIESKLIFWGVPQAHTHLGAPTAFITLPSTCTSKPVTYLHVDSYEAPGQFLPYSNETPVTATGCGELAFNPSLSLTAETGAPDQPDGVAADLHVPQLTGEPSKPDSPDVEGGRVTLPEGLTLDPSAANGLVACSDAQFAEAACPAASGVGSVLVDAPGIPNGSLTGGVYVGVPEAGAGPESGGEYRMFVIASAPQYGVGLHLEGRVVADSRTGRLTAVFSGLPQVPFEDFVIYLRGGPRAPLANPLACGAFAPSASILPYTGESAATAGASGFSVSGCGAPLPFSLVQGLASEDPRAGAHSPFTFRLSRGDSQQYVSRVTTTLPPGLVGAIPSVTLCGEAQANAGTCPVTSQIGTVTVAAGAGTEPYAFTGRAYLTGPYAGDPYGLSVVVPAVAGPYDLGEVVTRAGISVGLYDGRVTVDSTLPSVVGGVPLRLKSLAVNVNRPHFASNPTSCGALSTDSALLSTMGAHDPLSSPFQAVDCGALAFKPQVRVSTTGRTSKAGGASIRVSVTQPAGQANIRELQLQLPKQLVARGTTLRKACLAASFESGIPPGTCQTTARVGTVAVTTPVLPGVLTGTAWLVSHGGEAFPDLDLVLKGDNLEVVLVGHTHIARSGVTTSTYEHVPDVPVTSVKVNLPTGPNSALSANGRVCASHLLAPTTLIAQTGAKLVQKLKVAVDDCPLVLLSHKAHGGHVTLRMWVPKAGRVSVAVAGANVVHRRMRREGDLSVTVSRPSRRRMVHIVFAPAAGHRSIVKLALG